MTRIVGIEIRSSWDVLPNGSIYPAGEPHYQPIPKTVKPCEDCGEEIAGNANRQFCTVCVRRRARQRVHRAADVAP